MSGTSDYEFRGVSQTAGDPALQASFDFAHRSGFYTGIWISNVDYDNCCNESVEIDLWAGGSWETAGGFFGEGGMVWYTYPGVDADLDYPEIYVGAGYSVFDAMLFHSWDNFGSGEDGWYVEANLSFELPARFGLRLHAGYDFGESFDPAISGLPNYGDYSIGGFRSWGPVDFVLRWVGTTLPAGSGVPDRFVLSISTTIPSGK